jgi:4-amino-4-deoxy-L-arabinose transferase-like glycosyltransferase
MNTTISERSYRVLRAIAILALGIGLTRDLHEPWIGLHDWNGAFYSQLARNLLRYPLSVHHGMGVVAVGAAIPAPDESSIYATHPPGLVWLVAAAFAMFGEREAVARCVPIACSLGSLALLMTILRKRLGKGVAALTGLFVGFTPMMVYFGRMVNHEAVCLFFMLAAIACWDRLVDRALAGRALAGLVWAATAFFVIWVDWPGSLFMALYCGWLILMWRRGETRGTWVVAACAWSIVCITGLMVYLVYAGFDGRWADLYAVFLSRREALEVGTSPTLWSYTLDNLQWPLLILFPVGLVHYVRHALSTSIHRHKGPFTIDNLNILMATGLLWVLIFLRQYRIHNYWLYYLGPHIALCGALAVHGVHDLSRRKRSATWGAMIIIGIVVGFGIRGTAIYYDEVTCRPRDVEVWKQGNAMSKPTDRIRLAWDPRVIETHGGYRFVNIAPAQLAYYLDRAIDVDLGATK